MLGDLVMLFCLVNFSKSFFSSCTQQGLNLDWAVVQTAPSYSWAQIKLLVCHGRGQLIQKYSLSPAEQPPTVSRGQELVSVGVQMVSWVYRSCPAGRLFV